MGEVWEAEDINVRRSVALKLLKPELALAPDFLRRFEREGRLAQRITHPNSVAIHEIGQRRDGSLYIVQELLKGKNLRAHLADKPRLTLVETFEIVVPIMGGDGGRAPQGHHPP